MSDEQLYPLELFNLAAGEPLPSASREIVFDAPLSFGVLLRVLEEQQNQQALDTAVWALKQALTDTIYELQRIAGVGIKSIAFRETDAPGVQLFATESLEVYSRESRDYPRPHVHVYIGFSGRMLNSGQQRSVDFDHLEAVLPEINRTFRFGLVVHTGQTLDLQWREVDGVPEIVDPPLHEVAREMFPSDCPGPFKANVRYSTLSDDSVFKETNSPLRDVG